MKHTVRVLVVDDDDAVRGFVERALNTGGYEVTTASSGR
jgi:CheY-like chemotaxis protein